MKAVFSFADYCEPDWGEIELSEDWSSYRTFWAAVIQFATADQAETVIYDLDSSDDCLATVIGDEKYTMVPPPSEFRKSLLGAVRRLAAGGRFRRVVRRLLPMGKEPRYLGEFVLQLPGQEIGWRVYDLPNGVSIQRLPKMPNHCVNEDG